MAFQIIKTFSVKAAPDAVWSFLIDPHRVAGCMPGAAITSQIDERTFTGTMTVKVGPVTTSYKGKVVFERLDAEQRAAEIVATGQDVKGKGGASMKLSSTVKQLASGETEITATSDVTITGLLAQMGRGMIQDVSDQLFQVFSQNMRVQLEAAAPAATAAPAARDSAAPAGSAAAAPEAGARSAGGAEGQVLDLGGIGARAAGRAAARMFASPTFWIVLAVIAGVIYLLFIR